jgi:hypothetical protein
VGCGSGRPAGGLFPVAATHIRASTVMNPDRDRPKMCGQARLVHGGERTVIPHFARCHAGPRGRPGVPQQDPLLRHGPTESQGSVRQLAWTLVGRRPALSVRGCLARTGRRRVSRASDLRRRGAAGESGQSPGHSPVQRWNARALPRSIRALTRE